MCAAAILGYSAVAQSVQCVFELPKGVAVEIEACEGVSRQRSKDRLGVLLLHTTTHLRATSCATGSAASSIDTMLF